MLPPCVALITNCVRCVFACLLLIYQLSLHLRPKASANWAHRKWLLQREFAVRALRKAQEADRLVREILHREFRVVDAANRRKRRNLYAWEHRLWVIRAVVSEVGPQHGGTVDDALLNELDRMRRCMRRNISDHSCHHYIRQLLALIGDRAESEGGTPLGLASIFGDEVALNSELIRDNPSSESLWLHRRFLVTSAMVFLSRFTLEANNGCGATLVSGLLDPEAEVGFARELADASLGCADKYVFWIYLRRMAGSEKIENEHPNLLAASRASASRLLYEEPYHAGMYEDLIQRFGADVTECDRTGLNETAT